MEDGLLKKMEDDLKQKSFSIPLKFRGKPFLGLAQLSKIFKPSDSTIIMNNPTRRSPLIS